MKINPLDLESQSDIYQSDQALGMELSWMQMKLCIKMSDYKSLLVLTSSHISPSGACVARLAFLEVKTGSKQRKQAKLTFSHRDLEHTAAPYCLTNTTQEEEKALTIAF